MSRATTLAVALALLAVACGHGGVVSPMPSRFASVEPSPSASTSSPEIGLKIHLQQVGAFVEPIAIAVRKGDPNVYLAQKNGEVLAVRPGTRAAPKTVLDVSSAVSDSGEQGFLGLAFSPDGQWLYGSYTDTNGDSNVVAYRFTRGRAVLPGRRILFVHQPYSNHNGGNIAFGPDGYLYFGLGDGGSEGDPENRGQEMHMLLSKMLRIDPTPDGMRPYVVPPSNPFVGRSGIRPEIWAWGLRNPWRWSFDRVTGDLWIGDVGQSMWEEVDVQPANSKGGENYGWSCFEGSHPYKSCRPAHVVMPVYQYSHANGGCAVTGGYVYRGADTPRLDGAYVFGDYCAGRLMALFRSGGQVQVWRLGPTVEALDSFGQDANGELYALSLNGPVYRLVARG